MAKRSYPLTKYLLLRKLDRTCGTPLVVFTMSKTASTAIYNALGGRVANPLLRTHMLAPDSLAAAEQHYRRTDPSARPTHLFNGFHLLRHPPTPARPWLVVTIVRDPIARSASDFFQGAERFGRLDDPATITKRFEQFVLRTGIPRAVNWFDREFEPAVGVVVYDHPFDPTTGYGIIEVPQARILVLRQESLEVAPAALARFLGLPDALAMGAENVGSEKGYRDLYARVLGEARFSPETLDAAYCSRFAHHFYRPDEVAAFRRRWQGPPSR